jgi:hypothetical protein
MLVGVLHILEIAHAGFGTRTIYLGNLKTTDYCKLKLSPYHIKPKVGAVGAATVRQDFFFPIGVRGCVQLLCRIAIDQ